MSIDQNYLSKHYASLSDEALESIGNSDLAPEARSIFETELENRIQEKKLEKARRERHIRVNEERTKLGLLPIDSIGRSVFPKIMGVSSARSWCMTSIWVFGVLGCYFAIFPPYFLGIPMLALIPPLYLIRKGLLQNKRWAAIGFLLVIPVSIGLGAITLFFFSYFYGGIPIKLRLSNLGGVLSVMLFVAVHYLFGLVVAIGLSISLYKRRFLSAQQIKLLVAPLGNQQSSFHNDDK